MKQVLVLGRGYFGTKLAKAYKTTAIAAHIENMSGVIKLLKAHKPQIIINCTGFTGSPNVDDCENNLEKTLIANTFVPILLAEFCVRLNIKLVHISTGCLYEPHDFLPIGETLPPDFFALYYSRTKIYSESALVTLSQKFPILILRPRIPLDVIPHPKNILTKILKFEQVINCANSVTYMPDFIKAVQHLIAKDARGLYNVVNSGGLKYTTLLKEFAKHSPIAMKKVFCYTTLPTPRTNLILSTAKLKATGFEVRPIDEVLAECVKEYLKNSSQKGK